MPLGTVPVDRQFAAAILQHSAVIVEDRTPIFWNTRLKCRCLFCSRCRNGSCALCRWSSRSPLRSLCQTAAHDLAATIRSGRPVLIVASTDMSHYESRQQAAKKDSWRSSGFSPLTRRGCTTVLGNSAFRCAVLSPPPLLLLTALELGATRAELVRYTDSGEASGDTSPGCRLCRFDYLLRGAVLRRWIRLPPCRPDFSLTTGKNPSIFCRSFDLAGGWSNGKTADSDSAYRGSNPCPPAM
jgi:AmmeMemoRadiSam system protein B